MTAEPLPRTAFFPGDMDPGCDTPELVELSLLLPRRHAQAIERSASERGLTIGQYLRRIIGETVAQR